MIRFHSLIRVIFTNKKIKNRPQRDFLREKKINSKGKIYKLLKKKWDLFSWKRRCLLILFNYWKTGKSCYKEN